MCGIIGIVGRQAIAPAIVDALTVLQHRGQDAAGMATLDGHRLNLHRITVWSATFSGRRISHY
jgi:amidophosphoribosyltransferase